MLKYLIPFLIAFIIAIIFIILGIILGRKIKKNVREGIRHIHSKRIFRFGGIAIIIAFNSAIIFNKDLVITPQLWGILAASWAIMIVGTWDDFKEMFWKAQLFYQVTIAVFVFIMGIRIYYITNPLTGGILNLDTGIGVLFSAILVIFWITLMINALNWLDGIDGLSGGITFIGAITIFFLSLKPEVNQPPMAILAMSLAGASLGFLIFNFYPSRILAGTAGSMFMGFSLAVLAIFAGTKIATSLLVMSLPLIDFIWVIGERYRSGRSIFKADKSHLHHKLIELGWSQKKISLFFYLVTILISIIALNTRTIGKSITLILTALIVLIFLTFINKKIKNYKKIKD